jgi:hypothetical protein
MPVTPSPQLDATPSSTSLFLLVLWDQRLNPPSVSRVQTADAKPEFGGRKTIPVGQLLWTYVPARKSKPQLGPWPCKAVAVSPAIKVEWLEFPGGRWQVPLPLPPPLSPPSLRF